MYLCTPVIYKRVARTAGENGRLPFASIPLSLFILFKIKYIRFGVQTMFYGLRHLPRPEETASINNPLPVTRRCSDADAY